MYTRLRLYFVRKNCVENVVREHFRLPPRVSFTEPAMEHGGGTWQCGGGDERGGGGAGARWR